MCKKQKGLHNRIDPCMKNLIRNINLILPSHIEMVACCCGHGKYPMTIIVNCKTCGKNTDMVSDKVIPRTRKFYKKDNQGYYYIPKVV